MDTTLQAFAAALQVVVASGVVSGLPSPAPDAPVLKFNHLSLLHLRFAYRVEGDSDLLPIWEAVVQGRVKTEGLAILN